jgi:hypothetical protein
MTNFLLMYVHKLSLADLENMMPWERDIYVNLLAKHLKEQHDKQQAQNAR